MTGFRYPQLLLFCLLLLFSAPYLAKEGDAPQQYAKIVAEMTSRLEQSLQLYQQNRPEQARREIQKTYFELFENLEGPIRINVSAQQSYQMEASFAEIRRLINQGQSTELVQQKIAQLTQALNQVLPALEQGAKIKAEGQHNVYSTPEIAPRWLQAFRLIDDNLAQAVSAYEQQGFKEAKALVQQAQYAGYKNSELEIALRQHRSTRIAANINQQFYNLIRLTDKAPALAEFGYQITLLLQAIEEQLPNLPAPQVALEDNAIRENAKENAKENVRENIGENQWAQISQQIKTQLQTALTLYQQGNPQQASLLVQDSYFDVFEASGLEAQIGAQNEQVKIQLEREFSRLVAFIEAEATPQSLQQQLDQLALQLDKAVALLQPENRHYGQLLLYGGLLLAFLAFCYKAYRRKKTHDHLS